MSYLSEYELREVQRLCNIAKDYSCFEFEGYLIRGDLVTLVKRYVKLNPSDSFTVWLINNNFVIEEI